MKNNSLLNNISRNFMLLEEKVSPSVVAYIQSLSETLESLRPSFTSDKRRIEIAKSHLKEVKKHVNKLEEQVYSLEEKVKLLEETKEKDRICKVTNKKLLKKNQIQLNLHDGSNILTKDKINTHDTIYLSPENKITKHIPLEKAKEWFSVGAGIWPDGSLLDQLINALKDQAEEKAGNEIKDIIKEAIYKAIKLSGTKKS
mgnify:CR=1 FL=1